MPEQPRLDFRKSSYSTGTGQNCVEVARTPTGVAVRDSQNRKLGHLAFDATEWHTFLKEIKEGNL